MQRASRTAWGLSTSMVLFSMVAVSQPAVGQTCNCSCDAVIPQTLEVQKVFRNEGPGLPLFYVTAGQGRHPCKNREIRHANEFLFASDVITHVCVNMKYPTGQPGDIAYVFIAEPDGQFASNPIDAYLPGNVIHETPFQVNVGINGGHLLVKLHTPVMLSGTHWVGVRVPEARCSIPHMAVSGRTQGRAAVYIGGGNAPGGNGVGGNGGWRDYESTHYGKYVGKAPLIRPLTLVPPGGANPCNGTLLTSVARTPAGLVETTELGAGAQVKATLSQAPTSTVWVQVTSTRPTEGMATVAQLAFHPFDWNVPQTFDVFGIDDTLPDGPVDYRIGFFMTSADPCFDQRAVPGMNCVNIDDETAGFACGGEWTPASPVGVLPPPLEDPAMVFDSWRGVAVMYGGAPGGVGPGETWEWDGSDWKLAATTGPGHRRGHAMAFDAFQNVTVLMGGMDGAGTPMSDTWQWDGHVWTQASPGGIYSPGGTRVDHAMAFDEARGRVVLYGGEPMNSVETWEWNGSDWLQRFTASYPAPRSKHVMTFDTMRQRVILYGGELSLPPFVDDNVWEYDGVDWVPVAPLGVYPLSRSNAGFVHDPIRGVSILFGGEAGGPLDDTWEWDGNHKRWSAITPTGATPMPRARHALAFDTPHGVAVAFGGGSGPGSWISDTWKYRPIGPTAAFTTRYFNVGGTGTGLPFNWSISGPNVFVNSALPSTFPPGLNAYFMASQFAGMINGINCGHITAATSPVAPSVLTVNASSTLPYTISVGPPGSPPGCTLSPAVGCVINPTLIELLLDGDDCNFNGIDDILDIANDPWLDMNLDNWIDTCPVDLVGDMNCDNQVNELDIPDFVQALIDPDGYSAGHPSCSILKADSNADELIDGADLRAFIAALGL